MRFLLQAAVAQGRLRPQDPARPEASAGFFVIAMGKMGAFELNYSSDIDLICLFDPKPEAFAPEVEVAPFFIRLTRSLVRLLGERTPDGYVFRVDLRLRPDPGLTQVALSTGAALGYYESVGQNWERAAFIKARVCAGDLDAGAEFLRHLSPFIWRKFLDYAAVADVHAMKRQIHSYRGHDEIAVEGHNVKVGRGGIREIEFFVQTQQLIAGGRHPELRGRGTIAMLAALAAGDWIDAEAAADIERAYVFLRTVEHRLQMVNDEQTHSLPVGREMLESFARFLGYPDRDAFAAALVHHLRVVQRRYAELFETPLKQSSAGEALRFPPAGDDRETLDRLAAMGFERPLEASATVRHWLSGSHGALRGDFARAQLEELLPTFLTEFARAAQPDAALLRLDRFLSKLHGGARLLALLRQNTGLVALIASILASAPRLGDILGQHPHVMDALIDPAFFGALPDEAELARKIGRELAEAAGYEDLLDKVRLFRQEQLFLIGTRILSGTVSARQAGEAFARIADVLLKAIQTAVEKAFAEAHGRMASQALAVVAMGKLGGREMAATSDLDLIVVYDFDAATERSDGARPLYASQYFSRLTQRLVGALTAPTTHGSLYAVDLRLRPSGRSGPVATQVDSFANYQRNEAWTWEHMALTRARVVSGAPALAARIEAIAAGVLSQPREAALIAADVLEMRGALAAEKGDGERWDLKFVAGGLVDIEFVAQFLQLVHAASHPEILDTSTASVLDRAWHLGLLAPEDAETLRPAVRLYQDLTQILRLCLPGAFDPKSAGAEILALLARAAELPDFAAVDAHVAETQRRVRASFARILSVAP